MKDFADKSWIQESWLDDMWADRQVEIERLNRENLADYQAKKHNRRLNRGGICVDTFRNFGGI